VLLFLSLTMFGNYYIYDCINPLVDIFKAQLGFSDSQIGWLNAIYSVAAVLTLLIGGVIIDRIGTKKSLLGFSALCLVGAILTALEGGLPMMLAGRLVLGLGAESMIVAVTTALAKWFKGKELGFAFGLNLTIARLGSVAADNSPNWAARVVSFDSWQQPLFIGIGAGVICAVAAMVYWGLEARAERRYALGHAGETDKIVLGDVFRFSKSYWYIVALCFTFYSAIFPFRTFAIKFFMESHGASRGDAGALNGLLPLSAMIATPLFGLLVDRVGRRAMFMALGSVLLMPVYLMMAYLPSTPTIQVWLPLFGAHVWPVSLFVSVIMMGVAFSLIPAVMWPSVAYIVGQGKLGTAYALMTLIQQIGFFALNLIIGKANDLAGASAINPQGYVAGMWIFSVLGILGVVFSLLLRRTEAGPGGHGLETITTAAPA
jgi:MFS family permease